MEERAQRLFGTKGKSLESLDPSLFAKNPKAKGPKKYVGVNAGPFLVSSPSLASVLTVSLHRSCRDTERNKEIAFLEAQVYEYVEVLGVSPASAGPRPRCRAGL